MPGMLVTGLIVTAVLGQGVPQRPPSRQPLPSGQRLTANDGDTVVAENGARVRFIRRTPANIRAIFNSAEHWLVLLIDSASPDGRPPDGGVDVSYNFNDISGEWPLGERWEGAVTIEEYSTVGEAGMSQGVGLVTGSGLVQLLGRMNSEAFRDPSAMALTYSGSGRGGRANTAFDVAEAQEMAALTRNARNRAQVPGGFSTSVGMSIEPVSGGGSAGAPPRGNLPAPEAPVRVGGNIATPRKIVDAAPITPPEAVQANLRGVVIVEIVIGADGAVRDAKVLRSVPLLDKAALDAVRQWRYEPTLLNGMPVPVIMTATVNFQ
jgi:TonB family protein